MVSFIFTASLSSFCLDGLFVVESEFTTISMSFMKLGASVLFGVYVFRIVYPLLGLCLLISM